MRLLLILFLFLFVSFNQDYVLICKGPYAYAYHKHQCSGLKRCRSGIAKIGRQEAIRMQRTACEICYAGKASPSRVVGSSVTPLRTVDVTGQCNATTKKGTRCSRSARSACYCWQHGG